MTKASRWLTTLRFGVRWRRLKTARLGLDGVVVGRDGFGASAPVKDVMKHFGFTGENVYNTAKALLAGTAK